MGVYAGFYERCPRCREGHVHTMFISVSPMSSSSGCSHCGAVDFPQEELERNRVRMGHAMAYSMVNGCPMCNNDPEGLALAKSFTWHLNGEEV